MNENKSMIKSVGILTALVLLSKIIALVREMTIAAFYGVSSSTDAYFLAIGFITNIFIGINAALSTVFLPQYVSITELEGREKAKDLCSSIFSTLSVIAVVALILLNIGTPFIAKLLAPTFSAQTLAETVLYMRICSVTVLFSLLVNLLTSVLNAERRFGYGALASVLYSITSILCMYLLKKYIGVAALAVSVPLSFMFQLIILIWKARPYTSFRFHLDFKNPTLKRILLLMLPVLMGNATAELNQMITRTLASMTGEGTVSVLNYTNTLINFVLSALQATFLTVYFSEFSHLYAIGDNDAFSGLFHRAGKVLFLILLPVSLITFLFSNEVVHIVFVRGAFSLSAAQSTAQCLAVYAIAFLFYGIRSVTVQAFYASGNTKVPMINSLFCIIITTSMAALLSRKLGVLGIIIAITSTELLSTVLLLWIAGKRLIKINFRVLLPTLCKAFIAAGVLAVFLVMFSKYTQDMSAYVRFFGATAIGASIYAAILWLLKCEEMLEVVQAVKGRFMKKV